jgi:hypothetical protein
MPLIVNVFLIVIGAIGWLVKLPARLLWRAVGWFVPPRDPELEGEDGQPG